VADSIRDSRWTVRMVAYVFRIEECRCHFCACCAICVAPLNEFSDSYVDDIGVASGNWSCPPIFANHERDGHYVEFSEM